MRRAAQRGGTSSMVGGDEDENHNNISLKEAPPPPSSSFAARRRRVKRLTLGMMPHKKYGCGLKKLLVAASAAAIILLLRSWWIAIGGAFFSSTREGGGGGGVVDGGGHNLRGRGSFPGVGGSAAVDDLWIHPDSQPFNENSVASLATHLIVVAGHSVLVSGNVRNAAFDDAVWFLYDYQRGRGLPHAIVSHIRAGIRIALNDPGGLLVFSGGETRSRTGPETEGGSYYRVADALDLWDGRDVPPGPGDGIGIDADDADDAGGGDRRGGGGVAVANSTATATTTVRARTVSEEYATDSFENLMFSVCRFREVTGRYPDRVSVVSFTFKRRRFETLHASALRWPLDRFDYVGVDPPPSTGFDLSESSNGEYVNSLLPFASDPYGCHSEVLQKKRRERNPYARTAPYELTCPEMKHLLHWCGPELISEEELPWGGNFT